MNKPQAKRKQTVALVGAETLLGKEIEDVLQNRIGSMVLGFAASGEGNFAEAEGEAVYLEPLATNSIANARVLLVAGSAEGARRAYELAKSSAGQLILIDCTGHLESQTEARIVSPLVSDVKVGQDWLFEIAHPAASALALVIKRLSRYCGLRQVVAHVFEPASEQGRRGLSELHEQTSNLLAFKPLKRDVFDAQLTFNMLAQYGSESIENLAAIERRIERQVATLLSVGGPASSMPMPSIRLIGAPVFHGYSFSIWVECDAGINAQALGEALASAQIEIRGESDEPPNSVGAASQSGLIAGDIRIDRNNSRAAWLWIAADNLRLTADAAADLVSQLESTTT